MAGAISTLVSGVSDVLTVAARPSKPEESIVRAPTPDREKKTPDSKLPRWLVRSPLVLVRVICNAPTEPEPKSYWTKAKSTLAEISCASVPVPDAVYVTAWADRGIQPSRRTRRNDHIARMSAASISDKYITACFVLNLAIPPQPPLEHVPFTPPPTSFLR